MAHAASTIMIEGQEGLTWERWRRLARTVEDAGYAGLFRSDHLTGLLRRPDAPLARDVGLADLAGHGDTQRIRFGPLRVSAHLLPAGLLAKRAAAVAELSGGRFDLGIGAGWHEGEHAMFGIPFPPAQGADGPARVRRARDPRAVAGPPVTLEQPYYPLRAAQSFPLPPGGTVPLIIGGGRREANLRIVAEHADEWNITRVTFDEYAAKRSLLEDSLPCRWGAMPRTIRRSLMVPIIMGQTAAEVTDPAAQGLFDLSSPARGRGELARGRIPLRLNRRVVRDLKRWEELGIQRLMLQLIDQDDLEVIELIARHVLPEFRR